MNAVVGSERHQLYFSIAGLLVNKRGATELPHRFGDPSLKTSPTKPSPGKESKATVMIGP